MDYSFTDSHAHLTSSSILDPDGMVERAKASRVQTIINICTDRESLEKGLLLAQRHKGIYNAAATTPHEVAKEGEELFPFFAEHARKGDLVAIGETGLDYYYAHSPKEVQREFLSRYLQLALACKLPVIFHCRDAFQDLFALCDSEYKGKPALLHCFTGTMKEAEGVLERGWYLSFSGIITFKKSQELREVVRNTPLDRLLIETDTPFLAPQSKRGKVNEPSYLPEIAELIAREKGLEIAAVARAATHNIHYLFSLSH